MNKIIKVKQKLNCEDDICEICNCKAYKDILLESYIDNTLLPFPYAKGHEVLFFICRRRKCLEYFKLLIC